MTQSEFETLKAIISESSQLNTVDIGDWTSNFEPDFELNVVEQLRTEVRDKLLDGENIIDLYWDILNWASNHYIDKYPQDREQRLEEEDMLMAIFWDEASKVLIEEPKKKKNHG